MNIGFIGAYGGQAKRILRSISMLNTLNECFIIVYEHRIGKDRASMKGVSNFVTYRLADLLKCDCIIICSPTDSHFYYLNYFYQENYKGFILCEKPPAKNYVELDRLDALSNNFKKRLLFDLNLRFSYLQSLFNRASTIEYGRMRLISIQTGHGLAYKKDYIDSWRNNAMKMQHGISETVGIHYIDLAIRNFGKPNNWSIDEVTSSSYSRVPDNSYIDMHFDNDVHFNLFISYTTPLIEDIKIVFENAVVIGQSGDFCIYSPRDTYDEIGYFSLPPLKRKKTFANGFWDESINNTVKFFYRSVKFQRGFTIDDFNSAIDSNRFMIDMFGGSESCDAPYT